ncbi:MAG: metal-dependent hydrolase [Actinomycetota bacterium]|jgi:L-ascorbate metabolism protein UlaG (beta-lactamase superfamily)|nr:metal-dependent hydrolase [Rubrobacter sp.]MDQ3509164.1 metal-dependent hydrolase [Actinomycetota bacterium]
MEQLLGGARITYLGHATFRLTTAGDEQIIIDPFITDNPQTPEELKEVGELDTILLTHGHFDHFGDTIPLAKQTGATVVANFETFAYLQSQGIENAMPLNKGGTAQVGGIKVTGTNAFHSSSIQTEDGSTIYGGEPMGFVVEFESGFKLYHAGDTCVFGDMALIGEIYNPDLALLPIGNNVVMSPFEAAHATRLLGVDHVVPIHYGTFPFVPGTPDEFKGHLSDLGVKSEVHVMSPGDRLAS